MKNIFHSFDEFQEELSNVINFHDMVNDTIVSMLKAIGTVYVPEDKKNDYCFSYLDFDDIYITKTVTIDPSNEEKYCLIGMSASNDEERVIFLEDINNDIVIEEKIIRLVFDAFSKFNKN